MLDTSAVTISDIDLVARGVARFREVLIDHDRSRSTGTVRVDGGRLGEDRFVDTLIERLAP